MKNQRTKLDKDVIKHIDQIKQNRVTLLQKITNRIM